MILKTGNSVYEVDEEEKRFRLVGRNDPAAKAGRKSPTSKARLIRRILSPY